MLRASGHEFVEVERLEDAMPSLDLLYMTRVQKERFFNEEDYVRMKDFLYSGQGQNGTGKTGYAGASSTAQSKTRFP